MEKGAGGVGVVCLRESAAKKMVEVSWPYRMLFVAMLTRNLQIGRGMYAHSPSYASLLTGSFNVSQKLA